MKTRHGKVLTTSGELLHLSEEDFQKVRTSRKKKSTIALETIIDEDVTAPEAILQYEDSNCDMQENGNESYKDYNQFTNDEGTVWMEENVVHIMSKEEKYNSFKIESETENENDIENNESRVDKTDYLETEEGIENEHFNSRHLFDRISQPICSNENNSIILDGTVETDLEFMKASTEILYEKNFHENHQEIYNVGEYENQIQNVGEEILGYEEEILQDVDVVQEVQVKFLIKFILSSIFKF